MANPFFCNNPNATGTGCTSGSALFVGAGATTTRRQLLRPFPNFGDINTSVNDGESWYHSGQFSLNKRFSQGYGLQFAYTKSKWVEATEYLNPADERPVKQRSPQDTPNRFSMSGFLELPFGRGKTIFRNANRLANMIVGGWQIQGTYVYQTGFPLEFANDVFYLGGDPGLPKGQQTVDRWFNTSAFVSPVGSTPPAERFREVCKLRNAGRSLKNVSVFPQRSTDRSNQQRRPWFAQGHSIARSHENPVAGGVR